MESRFFTNIGFFASKLAKCETKMFSNSFGGSSINVMFTVDLVWVFRAIEQATNEKDFKLVVQKVLHLWRKRLFEEVVLIEKFNTQILKLVQLLMVMSIWRSRFLHGNKTPILYVLANKNLDWIFSLGFWQNGKESKGPRETIWYHNEDEKKFDMVDLFREYSQFRAKGHSAFWQRPKKSFTVVC